MGSSRLIQWAILIAAASFATAFAQGPDPALLQGLHWRLIGPFRGGRVEAVAGVKGDPRTYYFGAVAGGVWKTTDGGATWKPIFDHESTQAIGAIGVAQSDPNILYVGTGEPALRNDFTFGNGMYKSVDGGLSWKHIGLEDTQHIAKVIVDPSDTNVVYVAAVGHASGPNQQRGVFKSTDGGATWKRVLFHDEKTGVIDLCMDPANPRILFAAMYQIYRAPWALSAGGPGSGLYKSTDGGETWTHLEGHGLPEGPLGRIGVAVAPGSTRIYALIEAKIAGGMYRSDDGGATWSLVNGDHNLSQRPWYFSQIFADPRDSNVVYSLAYRMLRSIDGGRTFHAIPGSHADHHALWIDPSDSRRMIEGNDGGATISVDGGGVWSPEDNQPTGQFYHAIADDRFPYRVYGAQQDSTSVSIASASAHGEIDDTDWYPVAGGESGYIAPDPLDRNIVYAGGYAGTLTRLDLKTSQAQMVSPWPLFMDGLSASQVKHRFNWTSPIVFSPDNPHALYNGAEVVFKTTDNGATWTAISPDLTRNDKSKQGSSGGPVSHDDAGTEYYDTVFTIAESKVKPGVIWAGADDGMIHVTSDGGKSWSDVTPSGIAEWGRVNLIEASPHEAAVAYAAIDRHLMDDLQPWIYRTDNYGRSWTPIASGIPATAFVHTVREDPERRGLLFAGTELGVYVSFDNGAQWQPLQLNLPHAPVYDLTIKGSDLIAATHGRSFWILDDITPLRQFQSSIVAEPAHLFSPRAACRLHAGGGQGGGRGTDGGEVAGKNPPDGAIIDYYLSAAAPVVLTIRDAEGHTVRTFHSREAGAGKSAASSGPALPSAHGLNRFIWDLRLDPPTGVPGAIYQEGTHLQGVLVMPGTYKVELTAAGKTLTAPLEVKLNPEITTPREDLQKQFDLAKKISDAISQTHATVNYLRRVHAQIGAVEDRTAGSPNGEQILIAAKAADQNALAVEDALFQINKQAEKDSFNYGGRLNDMLIGLEAAVERADTAPTQPMYQVFSQLDEQLQAQLTKKEQLERSQIPALNQMLRDRQIPYVGEARPGGR